MRVDTTDDEIAVELPAAPESAAEARRFLDEVASRLPREKLDEMRLLVSELVTNSIRHAGLRPGDRIRIGVKCREHRIRIQVGDPGQGFAMRPKPPGQLRESGYGLYLLSCIADRWGVTRTPHTQVWFEVDI